MKSRYYFSMLAILPLILIFNCVYWYMHQSAEVFMMTGLFQIIMYGALNLIGIYFLYRPIERLYREKHVSEKVKKYITRLGRYSTTWVFSIGFLYVLITCLILMFSPSELGDTEVFEMENINPILFLNFIPSLIFVYAIFPCFITYFVVNDFKLDLKADVFQRFQINFPASKRKIGVTLLYVFLVLVILPSFLVIIDLAATIYLEDEFADFTSANPFETVIIDRLVVLVGMIFSIIYVSRSFTKPIYSLLTEINKVRGGDFSIEAAIISDDEIGTLTRDFNGMVKGLKERELIRDTFGRYVTKDVARVILNKEIDLAGETRNCTVMVTDIANYTSISEGLTPKEVVAMLNEYFTQMVAIIQKHKGIVNKYIGDSVFAIFNVPLNDPDHATNAIRAALEIDRLTSHTSFGSNQMLTTRIGINTGSVVAGNIGSADRMEYTVMGDEVNIAARLEALNKQHGTHVLVGENTYEVAKDHFQFSKLGDFQLRGKEKSIEVYEVK